MASLEELQKKQADAAKFAMKMVDEKDPKVLLEMAEQMQSRCKDLERMAKGIEAALWPSRQRGTAGRASLPSSNDRRLPMLHLIAAYVGGFSRLQ